MSNEKTVEELAAERGLTKRNGRWFRGEEMVVWPWPSGGWRVDCMALDGMPSVEGTVSKEAAAIAFVPIPPSPSPWRVDLLVEELGRVRTERNALQRTLNMAVWERDDARDDLRTARADLAAAQSTLDTLRAERDAAREEVARLQAATAPPEPGAGLTDEEIAARCGLVRGEDEFGCWVIGDDVPVWRDEGGWNWDGGEGYGYDLDTLRSALLAYAAATGVDLGPAAAPPAEQPAPSGGTGDCWQEVLDALDEHGLGSARPLCEARRALGVTQYGVPLGRGDGRDAFRDAQEELLDAAVYVQRLLCGPRAVSLLAMDLLRAAMDPARVEELLKEEQEDADRELDQSCAVSDILTRAGIGGGPYVERIRRLALRARIGDALLDALTDDDGAAAVRALRALVEER